MAVEATMTSPRESKVPSGVSTMGKPFLICAAFVAGLFIASITFNLALYLNLKSKYDKTSPESLSGMSPSLRDGERKLFGQPPAKLGQPAVDIYNNIVMIKVRFATYNRCMPWQTVRATFQPDLALASGAQASGLILEKGLILTSAYVATDTYLVTVMRQGEPREYEAEVVGHAREANIALLSVKDPAFWHSTDITVKLDAAAGILGRGSEVVVAGFPVGADLSIAKLSSRVSRVEAEASGYAGRYGSFPQTVLSLYPSVGSDITVGPVFKESDNTLAGFIGQNEKVVPIRTIARFINAYNKDHQSGGLGMLGMLYRPMQALAMRMYWGLPMDNIGVQIRSIDPASELHAKVQKGDMLLAIDGEPILANGAVSYRKSIDNMGQTNDVALPFSTLLAEKSIGESAKLTFRRSSESANNTDGEGGYKKSEEFDVEVTMKRLNPLTPRTLDQKDLQPPTYFMLGGMVWTVFTEDLVLQAKATGSLNIPAATRMDALHRWRSNPDEQIIVLLRALEHPCNKWYSSGSVRILKFFNGKPVLNMKQFVTSVSEALKGEDELLKFTFNPLSDDDIAGGPNDPDIVLDRGICTGADKSLMKMHQVKSPASADLKEVYQTLPEQFTQMPSTPSVSGEETAPVDLPEKQVAAPAKAVPAPKPNSAEAASGKNSEKDPITQRTLDLPWTNVVQINLVSSEPDFLSPWGMSPTSASRCSAIIVDKAKKMILTNSHCVANAVSLNVLREDVPVSVPARVMEIAHDVDLAWITTDDESFWASQDIQPVVSMSSGLPHISHEVRVVGYPKGGSSITITQGIVSRVDGQIYPNGLMPGARNTPNNLLIVQVDAAINPGNSGGPVFDDAGNLVGLAFAVLTGANSVGYVIPNVHMRNFVASVESQSLGHRWKAQSETGAIFHAVENPGMRKFLRLQEGETGVQVRSVAPGSPLAENGVVKGDIMLKIDGMPVQGNGKVKREINGKMVTLPYDTIVTEKAHGDPTKLEFMHVDTATGERTNKAFEAVFRPVAPLVPRFYDAPMPVKGREHFAAKPTFLVLWGLVWGVFSNPVYQLAMGAQKTVPWSVAKSAMHRWRANDDEDVVVLLQGLGGSACTLNYDTDVMRVLQYFNGKKVNSMRDLVKYALDAESSSKPEDFMRITFEPLADKDIAGSAKDPDIVLHRKFCGTADEQLLQANGIAQPFSQDVLALFQEEMQKRGGAAQNPNSIMTHSLMQQQSNEDTAKKTKHRNVHSVQRRLVETSQGSSAILDPMAMRSTGELPDVSSAALSSRGTPIAVASDDCAEDHCRGRVLQALVSEEDDVEQLAEVLEHVPARLHRQAHLNFLQPQE